MGSSAGKQDWSKIFDSLKDLLKFLNENLGPWLTAGIILVIGCSFLCFFLWRFHNEKRKDKEINQVIAEKERTIQRLAQDNREWRILFFKDKCGWNDKQVQKFVLENTDFEDGPAARKVLEHEKENKNK